MIIFYDYSKKYVFLNIENEIDSNINLFFGGGMRYII